MKRHLLMTGVILFSGLDLFLIWFGWTYATVPQILSFHAAALPETARADVWPLYDALMNLIGGASIALGVLGLSVALGPLRDGRVWAALALSAANLAAFGGAAATAEKLAETGAPTSWRIMGVLLAFTAAALAASIAGGRPLRK